MKIQELDLVRAFCILAVIIVHSTSYATVQLTESTYFTLYQFVAGSPINKVMLFEFIDKLITGKAYTHLYFIFITTQFYLLFPVLLWLFKQYPKAQKWSIFIGIVIQWGFILGNKYQFHVDSRGSWCFSYFSYYMLGAWLGMYYPAIKAWFVNERSTKEREHRKIRNQRNLVMLGLWVLWLCSGILYTVVWYEARLYGNYAHSLVYDLLLSVFALTTLPVFIHASCIILSKSRLSIIHRLLNRLGALSFGVYLIHPFFLLLYRQFSPAIGTAWLLHLWYLGGFIVALGCSWIVVGFAARYLRFGWVLFGSLPTTNTKAR